MTVWPNGSKSKPHVSSPFGPRNINVPNASKNHKGTDFSQTFTIIRAVEAGQVKVAGTPGGWSGGGIQVWVQHDGYFSKSLHAASLLARNGQWVREGDPLCVMGETGTASDPHLHFEITYGNVHYSNTGQVDPVPFIAARIGGSGAASGGSSPEEDDMPSEQWLIQLGADIVSQVSAQVNGVKADVATVHNTVISGQQGIIDAAHAIRADVNYIHTLSPYSLKAILEASRTGEITLTDSQVKAIGGQLAAASVAGIDAALRDDFDGVKAQLALLPKATIAALKSAL